MSVKGPCHENECINGIAVPLGAPGECVGHRANVVGDKLIENCPLEMFDEVDDIAPTSAQLSELPMPLRRCGQSDSKDIVGNDRLIDEVDSESDASDEPEGLTDSSSEDDTVAPGGHVRRMVNGIEKLRRVRAVRRVRGHRPFAPFRQDPEDEPSGLNPSSEEDRHDSDDDSVDDMFPEDHPTSRASFSGGDSMRESNTGNATPNTLNQRTILRPSPIEETAIAVCSHAFSECEDFDHHPPVGSVGWSLFNTDDGSCKGTIHRPRKRQPLQAETLDQCSRALTGISMLQEVPRSGISAVQRPDEWVLIDVTVDSGACVSVMPSGLCTGISIVENDLSRGGVEYEVANGESIANLGERRCQVMTVGSMIPK